LLEKHVPGAQTHSCKEKRPFEKENEQNSKDRTSILKYAAKLSY